MAVSWKTPRSQAVVNDNRSPTTASSLNETNTQSWLGIDSINRTSLDDSVLISDYSYKPKEFDYFNSLKVFYANADQFLNKRDNFLLHISNNEPEIIMITEVLPKVELNFISEVHTTPNICLYFVYKFSTRLWPFW